jgi:hypothetical protein
LNFYACSIPGIGHQWTEARGPTDLADLLSEYARFGQNFVLESQGRHFRAPKPTTQKRGEDRAVAKALVGGSIRCVQERLRLPGGQPLLAMH